MRIIEQQILPLSAVYRTKLRLHYITISHLSNNISSEVFVSIRNIITSQYLEHILLPRVIGFRYQSIAAMYLSRVKLIYLKNSESRTVLPSLPSLKCKLLLTPL